MLYHQEMEESTTTRSRRVLLCILLCLSTFIFSCHGSGMPLPPSAFCTNIPVTKGNFSILAKPWPSGAKTGYRFSSVVFNCTTNDKDATVAVEHQTSYGFQNVLDLPSIFPNGSFTQRGQIIVLKELLKSQVGLYRCIAKSQKQDEICLSFGTLWSASRGVQITILPFQSPITVVKGETLTFSCRTPGGHSYLTWYKRTAGIDTKVNASVITESTKYFLGESYGIVTINIQQAKFADAGTYVCVRFMKLEGVRSEKITSVLVKDFKKPVIKLFPASNKVDVIEKTGKLPLVCQYISGDPYPTLEWTNPAGLLLEKCVSLMPSWPNCTLTVTNDVYVNGKYTCTALSPAGNSSRSIDVNILVPVELEKQDEKKLVAGYDERRELTCKVKRSNPLPTITWFYQHWSCVSKTCTPRNDSWVTSFPKVSLKPDANVPTNESKLVVPASKVAAFYSCQASNQIGKKLRKDFFNITLHRVAKAAKIVRLSAVEKSINENDTFQLNCSAAANIFNNIKWTKEGKDFVGKIPRINITNIATENNLRVSVITFQRVEMKDAGMYTCIGLERRGGMEKAQHNLTVLALKRPKITGLKDLMLNQSNQHAIMFCNASGHPMPSLTWKFRGEIINDKMIINEITDCQTRTQGFYYIAGSHQSKLVICYLNYKKFQGEYKCIAKNKIGLDESKFNVVIHVKPSIFTWSDKIGFEPGKSARLFCEAEGNPAPNVTIWKMERTNRIALKNVQRYGNGTAYVILKTNKDTKGQYACTAENEFGVAEKFTMLSVADAATRIQEKPVSTGVITTIVVCSVLFVIIVLAAAFCYKRKLDEKYAPFLKPNRYFQMDPDRSLFEQSSELPYDPDWEFPREKLTFVKMIGSGAFGEVWLTEAEGILNLEPRDKTNSASKRRSKVRRSQRYTHIQGKDRKKTHQAEAFTKKTHVAVKTLKGDASDTEYKDLASELKILIHIGENKQIVNLLGACTRGGKLCVILEYCPHGSLLHFLRERRDIFEPVWYKQGTDMGDELTHIDLTMVSYQIAKGMDFLASKKCVHRDVAARNVLVGVDYIVKIADFGLARDIYKDEFYMKSTSGLLPVKWMAPESLFDKIYTSQSDVWSYGIVLWEIFTLGGSPYPGLPTEDLFSFLEQGRRMDQSELCPLEIYAVMRDCWERNPNDRPLFSQIADRIGQIISNHSGQENPYLEFEKEEAGAQTKETDYLVPVVEQSGASNSKPMGDHGGISDEYVGVVHDNGASVKRSGRPSNASYENEDELRLNLINGSTSTDYANTRPYNDEDEAVV